MPDLTTKREEVRIQGGIASRRTRAQVEQFNERFPEWANLISFIVPSGAYRVITASSNSLSVDLTEHPWRLMVHQLAPHVWVAEIHDLDECARHPEVYIAPMVHTEGEDKIVVVGSALERARFLQKQSLEGLTMKLPLYDEAGLSPLLPENHSLLSHPWRKALSKKERDLVIFANLFASHFDTGTVDSRRLALIKKLVDLLDTAWSTNV